MPELPWEKWYPTNWASEPGLRLCRPSTRGIWFDALNTMMLSGACQISGTNEELCGLLSCLPVELSMAIQQLKAREVADIDERNGNITLTSRRRKRDCEIKEERRKAGRLSGIARTKHEQHPQQPVGTNTPTPSAYAYASASTSASNPKPEIDVFNQVEIRLFGLFKRKQNGMPYSEQADISRLTGRPDILEELAEIERFIPRARKPPQSLFSLVTGWEKFVDQARNFKPERSPEEEKRIRNLANQL